MARDWKVAAGGVKGLLKRREGGKDEMRPRKTI